MDSLIEVQRERLCHKAEGKFASKANDTMIDVRVSETDEIKSGFLLCEINKQERERERSVGERVMSSSLDMSISSQEVVYLEQ